MVVDKQFSGKVKSKPKGFGLAPEPVLFGV